MKVGFVDVDLISHPSRPPLSPRALVATATGTDLRQPRVASFPSSSWPPPIDAALAAHAAALCTAAARAAAALATAALAAPSLAATANVRQQLPAQQLLRPDKQWSL